MKQEEIIVAALSGEAIVFLGAGFSVGEPLGARPH